MQPIVYVVVIGGFVVVLFGIMALAEIAKGRLRLRQIEAQRSGGESQQALEVRVEELQHRVAELEERQDFAERLLAKTRERGLPAGPGQD